MGIIGYNISHIEGKANKAVIEALTEYFNVKKSHIILLSGEKSKIKLFEIIDHEKKSY